MRLLARVALVVGTVGVVIALGKLHAVDNDYDFTTSSRFAWSLSYIGMLCVAAYGIGLPDLVRGRRGIVSSAFVAPALAALGVSAVQLFAGDALLPRFVTFGAAALLVP